MKTLLLLRHAKSSWKEIGLSDHDRPLNKRGVGAASQMGRFARENGMVPGRIISSTAVRARTTAELFAEAAGVEEEILTTRDLYLASPGNYLAAAREQGEHHQSVLTVGHNPGIESLVEVLGGRWERMPTAALARVDVEIDSWEYIHPDLCRVAGVWRPKEIAP